jgi:Coenzyme PQQ synthesis protein D (PqqD)
MSPKARTERLLTQEVGAELVVYDLDRQEAHRLNSSAALVWRHCDGRTSTGQLTSLLAVELGLPSDPRLVEDALGELERAHLITGPTGISTRQKVALAGALALLIPVVESLVAPTPAAAFSW